MNMQYARASTKAHCPKCGAEGEISCNCGVAYVRAGDLAEKALADPANAGKSDRAIAEELGVHNATVSRARQKSTVANATVEKRVGRDGKARRPNKVEEVAKAIKAETGKWPNKATLAKEAGVYWRSADNALRTVRAVEEEVAEAVAEARLEIDLSTLPKTAQGKLEAAIRQEKKRLEAEYEQKFRTEIKAQMERVAPQLLEEQNEAVRLQVLYRKMIDEKAVFTAAQYNLIVMCLHPDNSASTETRVEAFRLFNDKKLQLTKER